MLQLLFLYQYFEFQIEKGQIKIRDKNYKTYINKDFHTMPTSYNKDWKKDEIIKEFIKTYKREKYVFHRYLD